MNILNSFIIKFLVIFFALIGWVNASPTKQELNDMKKIVGYFPNWGIYGGHRNYFPSKVPFNKVTHINVAFAYAGEPGQAPKEPVKSPTANTFEIKSPDEWADFQNPLGETWGSNFSGVYGQLYKYKLDNPGVSVLVSIGGWTLSGSFHHIAATEAGRKRFAEKSVKFMKDYKLDGVDIDWEFPGHKRAADYTDNFNDSGTPFADASEKTTFTLLLKALREELDKQGTTDNRYYQLTAAIGSSEALMNNTELSEYHKYLDMINIMSYDMHGAWENKTNHQSPLHQHPNLPDVGLTIEAAAKRLADAGVPKYKIVVGSPFYTRGWKGVEDDAGLKNPNGSALPGLYGSATGGAAGRWDGGVAAGVNAYYHVVNDMIGKDGFKAYRDEYSKVPYLYSSTKKEFYTYEDDVSVKAKVEFVKANGYGGIIFWELSSDLNEPGDGNTSVAKTAGEEVGSDTTKKLVDVVFKGFYGETSSGPVLVNEDQPTAQEVSGEKEKTTSVAEKKEEEYTKTKKDYQHDPAASSASAAVVAGIKKYDPNHGPASHPHYDKGEEVLSDDGLKIFKAKWYVANNPNSDSTGWSEEPLPETIQDVIPNDKKNESISAAEKVAEVIGGTETDNEAVDNAVSEIIVTAASAAINAISGKIVISDAVYTDKTAEQLKTELQAMQEQLNKCHDGKIYNTGDKCKAADGTWYQFKWWTKYDGTQQTSMTVIDAPAKQETIELIGAKGIKKWSASRVYDKQGIKVLYDDAVFESKYWTSGNKPIKFNDSTPWKFIGFADVGNEAVAENKEPEIKIADLPKPSVANPVVVDTSGNVKTLVGDGTGDKEYVESNLNDDPVSTAQMTTIYNNGDAFFMPFVDTTLWPPYDFNKAMDAGIKNFALAFVVSPDGDCKARWGNYDAYTMDNKTLNLVSKIRNIHQKGGRAMVSFGGIGAYNDLADSCKTVDDLAAVYQGVIDTTKVKMIDFDIEGHNTHNDVAVVRRSKALFKIQEANPDVQISYTLAVMPTGLVHSGLKIVQAAIDAGVKFKAINLMLMDYGSAFPGDQDGELKMAGYSIAALKAVNAQLKVLLQGQSGFTADANGEYYNYLGAIPMIGRNDVLSEWFFISDVKKLMQFCKDNGVRMTSMWSLNRDKPLSTGESATGYLYKSTKLPAGTNPGGQEFDFSKELDFGEMGD